MSEDQIRELVEYALKGARPPMEKRLGLGKRGYDAADEIAEGIDAGIRRGLVALKLTEGENTSTTAIQVEV